MKPSLCIWLLMALSFSTAQAYEPRVNGCGPSNLGFISNLIPDGPVPLSSTLFRDACNTHDRCYLLMGAETQASCDRRFLEQLLSLCTATYQADDRVFCERVARDFYAAVDRYGETSILFLPEIASQTLTFMPGQLDLVSAEVYGNELLICTALHNLGRVNTHFKLFLFAAAERKPDELPDADFQVAWAPLFEDRYFFIRAGASKTICLGSGGLVGIARTVNDLNGRYRLELWVRSERRDIGFRLSDALEGVVP